MSIDCIERHFEHALQKKCSEQGCSVNLRQLPNRVVLKGEMLDHDKKMCDCLFFLFENGKYTVALVELKGKDINVGDVVEKFRNSTRIASAILEQCGIDGQAVRWHHFLYSKAVKSTATVKKLRDSKVRLEGRRFNIVRKRCGASLREAIERLN